ncbi:MAG: efflux RND transporter permease subunit [Gemmatimonadaceae bacterium]
MTEPRSRWALFDVVAAEQRFIYLAVGLLSAAGLWAAFHLPSAVYPELNFMRITVVAQGSSLSARQQVFAVTRPIEEAVSIVPGVVRVNSRSIRGATEMPITFAAGTDMAAALELVRLRVDQVRGDLPPGLDIQIERMTPTLFPILQYNIEGGDPATLYDIARYQIKPVVSRVPGVGRVDVQGSDVREIEVIADPARLAAAGLTYDDLAAAIKAGIAVDAVGRVAADYKQYLVVSAQEAHSAEDVADVVVKGAMRVRDFATVVPGTEDHVRMVTGDGRPAALLTITRQPGGNTVAISDSVGSTMQALAKTLPPGVHVKAVYDQASLVTDAVHSVRDAMLIGAVLAVIILLLFLRHLRITAISASAIPLTLAITVFLMQALGQTFNLMTLGAMAIAIGLVIDDAVVITENIVRHLHLEADRNAAIRAALQELIWPVTTSTITTVVVFLPLGQLEGVAGQFFAALSLTLTVSVLVSLVLALTLIPLLSAQFLTARDSEHESQSRARGRFDGISGMLDALAGKYERALGGALHHPRLMIGAALVLVGLGGAAYFFVGTGFLPDMDEGAFILDYWSPGGTSLTETDRQLHTIENILAQTPEITGTSRRLGAELGLFATEQNRGDMSIRLKPESQRDRDIFKVMDEVRGKVAAAVPRFRVEFHQILSDVLGDAEGNPEPVEIKFFGSDLAALQQYAGVVGPKIGKIEGLDDFFGGIGEPAAEMQMKVRGAESARMGLTPEQVSSEVSGALLGVPAGEIHLDDRSIGIRVRAPDSVRFNEQRLPALPVFSAQTHQAAALGSLATFTKTDVLGEHLRENQQQMIHMTASVTDRPLNAVMNEVKAILAEQPPPAGIRVELGGQYASQRAAFAALLLVLGLAAVSVMAVMVIQFRSFVEPLVVLLAAPLSFVGALALLIATGTALNVSSFMGLILLVGLIVKNGIILLDFTNHRMKSGGVDLETGIREAARVRLRPILMTTLCTLFGLLPLALGLGAGSEMQKPLALAVIGGLALSTPITLFVVPVLLVAIRGRSYRLASS